MSWLHCSYRRQGEELVGLCKRIQGTEKLWRETLKRQHEKGITSNMCPPYIWHLESFSDSSCWWWFKFIALSTISSLENKTCSAVKMKTIRFHAIKLLGIHSPWKISSFTIRLQTHTHTHTHTHTQTTFICLALHKESTYEPRTGILNHSWECAEVYNRKWFPSSLLGSLTGLVIQLT